MLFFMLHALQSPPRLKHHLTRRISGKTYFAIYLVLILLITEDNLFLLSSKVVGNHPFNNIEYLQNTCTYSEKQQEIARYFLKEAKRMRNTNRNFKFFHHATSTLSSFFRKFLFLRHLTSAASFEMPLCKVA